jgi:CheY-like chemotaxis protein
MHVQADIVGKINAGYTVMVVDDDPSVLATYRRLLSRAGYITLTVNDPASVLAARDHSRADLILIDYKMPGMDGLSLLKALRDRSCRARCILVSAFLNEDVRSRAADLGVDRVMEKPVDCCQLRDVIRDLLPVSSDDSLGEATGSAKV